MILWIGYFLFSFMWWNFWVILLLIRVIKICDLGIDLWFFKIVLYNVVYFNSRLFIFWEKEFGGFWINFVWIIFKGIFNFFSDVLFKERRMEFIIWMVSCIFFFLLWERCLLSFDISCLCLLFNFNLFICFGIMVELFWLCFLKCLLLVFLLYGIEFFKFGLLVWFVVDMDCKLGLFFEEIVDFMCFLLLNEMFGGGFIIFVEGFFDKILFVECCIKCLFFLNIFVILIGFWKFLFLLFSFVERRDSDFLFFLFFL